jgi:arsenite methyltransferase
MTAPSRPIQPARPRAAREADSLFDHFPWIYAFCREHLFRDDTDKIVAAVSSSSIRPRAGTILDLGCGPGFYTTRLAEEFPRASIVGVDRSTVQIRKATSKAATAGLSNCSFARADVLALPWSGASADAVIGSRLFTILDEPERALAEMYRVLRPGGCCFIAEPRSRLRTCIPLVLMWGIAHLVGTLKDHPRAYREPRNITVMADERFMALISSQPWACMHRWSDRRYQYAVCYKAG